MIDIETDTVPVGAVGWSRFLAAVESADPTDETEWVEFKAGLNPADKEAQASIAKAIVAFANRDPHRAAKWFDGYAFILLGIEPGSVPGAVALDPAKIHDGVHRLLADPAPQWDLMYVPYKDRQVLIITVAALRLGAPMYCIGKSSGSVRDGDVFVRHPGKSAPATAADVRRLSGRLLAGQNVALDVEVAVASQSGTDYAVARTSWPTEWLEEWIRVEHKRLLKPLLQEEREKARTLDSFSGLSPSLERLRGLGGMGAAGSFFEHPEDRTADGYRAEVKQYLDGCRSELRKAPMRASCGVLPVMRWTLTNRTDDNLQDVEIQVHVEGNVACLSRAHGGFSVRNGLRRPPRPWGPRALLDSATQLSQIVPQAGDKYRPTRAAATSAPHPAWGIGDGYLSGCTSAPASDDHARLGACLVRWCFGAVPATCQLEGNGNQRVRPCGGGDGDRNGPRGNRHSGGSEALGQRAWRKCLLARRRAGAEELIVGAAAFLVAGQAKDEGLERNPVARCAVRIGDGGLRVVGTGILAVSPLHSTSYAIDRVGLAAGCSHYAVSASSLRALTHLRRLIRLLLALGERVEHAAQAEHSENQEAHHPARKASGFVQLPSRGRWRPRGVGSPSERWKPARRRLRPPGRGIEPDAHLRKVAGWLDIDGGNSKTRNGVATCASVSPAVSAPLAPHVGSPSQ